MGDEKWGKLLDRHDALLRRAIEERHGEVIKQTGDGFFAAFDTPAAALDAAAGIQRVLDDEFVSVRIGLHSGAALERGNDYAGRGVNVAARVGALAGAGEILVSRETLDGVAVPYRVSEARQAELKGFDVPVDVVAVDWR
jgi:class 3 adenylate cyclase